MLRLLRPLVFSGILLLPAVPGHAQILGGVWTLKANGASGDLILQSVENGKVSGTIFGDDMRGTYDEKTHCLTLYRLHKKIVFQTYKGYDFLNPGNGDDKFAVAGTFREFSSLPGRPAAEYGWYAHLAGQLAAPPHSHPATALKIGKQMPFQIVKFLSTPRKYEGCPGVMISNSHARGMIIWSRSTDTAALQFAKEVDARLSEGAAQQGYLVVFDDKENPLQPRLPKWNFQKLLAGKAYSPWQEVYEYAEVDPVVDTVISLVDDNRVTALWKLRPGELTLGKCREILKELTTFFEQ